MRLASEDSRVYPSGDEWGVPLLLPEMQPTAVTAPVVAWGSVARTTRHGGTWVFYVDDRRFSPTHLAEQIAATEPAAAVEPNFSVLDWTPRAEALWAVFRKRRIARQLQEAGVPVYVDLCTAHVDIALLGVPRGWRAYATRGYEARAGDLRNEYALAYQHAGATPLLLVYGGGQRVRAICAELPGAVWCPDHMAVRRG